MKQKHLYFKLLQNIIQSCLLISLFALNVRADDSDNEYNFSWLDPDKKVYVLQNRKYRKAKRVGVTLSAGLNLSNPFKTGYMGVPRFSYWINDQFGIEVFYSKFSNTDNQTLQALRNVSSSALPYVREIKDYYGAAVAWVPWYSKINFFNKILYYDWGFTAGFANIDTQVDQNTKASLPPNYKSESLGAFNIGTFQNFFIDRNWSVRLDLMGLIYQAKGADDVSKNTYSNFDFGVGLGYLF